MAQTATKRRTRLDPIERRRLILDHTAEIVAAEGVAALSMERVGREAGISKSLVYNYFPNLNILLSELLERELRRLRRMQSEAAQGAKTFEGLVRAVTHIYLKYMDECGMLLERLQAEPSVSAVHDPTEYGRDAAVDHIAQIVVRHFELPPEIARAATDISFGLPASAGAYLHRHSLPREELEDITVTMIVGAVTALKAAHTARFKPLHHNESAKPRIRAL